MTRRSLLRDAAGATAVEFALIAPTFLLMLMGCFDLGYTLYVNSMLQGAIQQAARNSTIEGATTATQDALVSTAVKAVAPQATLIFTRQNYTSFSDVGKPEDWTDVDNNGTCNGGETFQDLNGNGRWDSDRGKTGQGGARDAILYTVNVTYPRPFAMAALARFSPTVTLQTETVLRNQPYNTQANAAPVTGTCP